MVLGEIGVLLIDKQWKSTQAMINANNEVERLLSLKNNVITTFIYYAGIEHVSISKYRYLHPARVGCHVYEHVRLSDWRVDEIAGQILVSLPNRELCFYYTQESHGFYFHSVHIGEILVWCIEI